MNGNSKGDRWANVAGSGWSLWEVSGGRSRRRKTTQSRIEVLRWIGHDEKADELESFERLHESLESAGVPHHFDIENHHITEEAGIPAPFLLDASQAERLLRLIAKEAAA